MREPAEENSCVGGGPATRDRTCLWINSGLLITAGWWQRDEAAGPAMKRARPGADGAIGMETEQ